MNYTKNYHLPQWVKSDRIMMEDFNAMNSSIENGLTQTAAKADTAAQTANAAAVKADTLPYVVGSYTGNGGDMSFNVGFRPSFLIVSGLRERVDALGDCGAEDFCVLTAGTAINKRVQFTGTGFVLRAQSSEFNRYPNLTEPNRLYDYIAFK